MIKKNIFLDKCEVQNGVKALDAPLVDKKCRK